MLKKYDVVGFKLGDELRYGVVEKGGSKKVTVLDLDSQISYSGPAKAFLLSDKPLPVDTIKTPMDDLWGIKSVKELLNGHGDSRTFEAFITYKGKKVIIVRNDGWGGCNEYVAITTDEKILNLFSDSVKAWVNAFPDVDDIWKTGFDVDDTWVEWVAFNKPYGVTAEQFLKPRKYL